MEHLVKALYWGDAGFLFIEEKIRGQTCRYSNKAKTESRNI